MTGESTPLTIAYLAAGPTPQPGETDEAYCRRRFGGQTFECRQCGTAIHWLGACDTCAAELEAKLARPGDALRVRGVCNRHLGSSWDNYKMPAGIGAARARQQIAQLQEWRGNPSTVVIAGPCGTGKTHLAVSVMRRFLGVKSNHGSARFITQAELLTAVRTSYNGGPDILSTLNHTRLLVLDDFGATALNDWAHSVVVSLLVRRHDDKQLTIITTNLSHKAIDDGIDARLASRLREAFQVVTLGVGEHRGAA